MLKTINKIFFLAVFILLLVFGYNHFQVEAVDSLYPWGSWIKNAGNPVLKDTDAQCFFPEVILSDVNDPLRQPILIAHPLRGTKYYWLYYETCWKGGGRLAYSSNLINWIPYEQNPVIAPVSGEVTLFTGVIFKDGDKFYIFYDVTSGCPSGTCFVIKYATANSPFGPWTRGPVVLTYGGIGAWDEGRVTEPFIQKYDDIYYLYYMGDLPRPFGRKEQIGIATAPASKFPAGPWIKQGLKLPVNPDPNAWDRGLVADPSVIQVGDKFYLLYTGSWINAKWRLGIAWANHPLGPWNRSSTSILSPGPAGSWDNNSILRGAIHYFNGKYYLPYAGSDGQNYQGGLATAKSIIVPNISPTPTTIPTPTPQSLSVEVFVNSNNGDAYQQGGTMFVSGSQIKMGWYNNGVGFKITGSGLAALKGKTIIDAVLRVTAAANTSSNIIQRIYLQASDNCRDFSTSASDITSRPTTANSLLWNIGTNTWSINKRYSSPDMAEIISEVTNRPLWDGSSLCVILKEAGSVNYAERYLYSKESGLSPASLIITYR